MIYEEVYLSRASIQVNFWPWKIKVPEDHIVNCSIIDVIGLAEFRKWCQKVDRRLMRCGTLWVLLWPVSTVEFVVPQVTTYID